MFKCGNGGAEKWLKAASKRRREKTPRKCVQVCYTHNCLSVLVCAPTTALELLLA